MENYDINTVGRGPAVHGIEWTIEGWKHLGSTIKESFSAVEKAYDPVQEMLAKEHEVFLRMAEDNNSSEDTRKEFAKNARESSTAAQTVASNRMTDVLKIVGAFATVTAVALGGPQYIKYINR
ncbi:MAG: hypothetical protein IJG48_01960 [Mogibacterium sp.]|nr:hypothetical protein [Mogibacterium sp.]